MLGMGKKKNTPLPAETPAPASGRKKPNRSSVSLHVYINPALRVALDAAVEGSPRPRASITEHVEVALERYLEGIGFWPPPAPPTN